MTDFQKKLLEVYNFTISFLKEHNLHYVACGGTVLGAARHNGFIPWDDDIDIYMWREDYNILLSLKNEAKSKGFDVLSVYTDKNYYCPFAKIIDTSTTIWEFKEFPFIMGAFVDIFPLDRYSWDDKKIAKIQKKGRYIFNLYKSSVSKNNFFKGFYYVARGEIGSAYRAFGKLVCGSREKALSRFLNFEKTYINHEGTKCVSGYQWGGKIFRTSWFEETIEVPFENTTTIIPKDFDAYLTLCYGDWRKLPPEENRVSNHSHYYLNFKERLGLEEAEARIKSGENFVM